MIISLEPTLTGLAETSFKKFAKRILARQAEGDMKGMGTLVEMETQHATSVVELTGQREEYVACVRVLGDLAKLRWQLVDSGYGLELHSPRPRNDRTSKSEQALHRKKLVRDELAPRVLQQFENPSVQKFIQQLERPRSGSGRMPVTELIADGSELQDRLRRARAHDKEDPNRVAALRTAIEPYLQLVDSELRDAYTGILLRDIWRYFRYTWSIPQTSIPGRHLFYLIRDAAHEHDAVIGIAGLSNCSVQLTSRDYAIGWSASGLKVALSAFLSSSNVHQYEERSLRLQGVSGWLNRHFVNDESGLTNVDEALPQVVDWLVGEISRGLAEIENRGLATQQELDEPSSEVVARLNAVSREFASQRKKVLEGGNESQKEWLPADIPLDERYINLDAKHSAKSNEHESRKMLVGKKRALELARLLDARRVIEANRSALSDPATVLSAMGTDAVRKAINTAMNTIKSRRIGTNMLEMTTCGAIAPYNRILGGKLVALLMLSPEVAADNLRRYGNEATIIRSQMNNALVVPDNKLVWLGTTSLYSHNSSQYERLRLPAGVIADDQPELRYTYLGNTSGYGTVQFSDDTVRSLEVVLRRRVGYQDVNSVFGEGPSPRLRKLRAGLDAIGFKADVSMLHHQERRIYGIPLYSNAAEYLCGLDSNVPSYVSDPTRYRGATKRITDFWRTRWLSSRLMHAESWQALGETPRWSLSSKQPYREPHQSGGGSGGSSGRGSNGGKGENDDQRLLFWKNLALAGSNAVSEGLSDEEFGSLHVTTQLEEYLLQRARAGSTIVLTGNAGDGKTHLARALRSKLADDASNFEFAFDATAMMSAEEGVEPIVDIWRSAERDKKRLVLAINQYPLYMLRQVLTTKLPEIGRELDRQWHSRLSTGSDTNGLVSNSLLLVDLSLRNPLARNFAEKVLHTMLTDVAVRKHAQKGSDPNFSFNYEKLSHYQVQERLFDLFDRLISAGYRATVRELWILTARLLFGTSTEAELPGAPNSWYSERLFDIDVRFPITEALRKTADPSEVSHLHIDRQLEVPGRRYSGGWIVGGEAPDALPVSALVSAQDESNRQRFLALKRRFFFEHSNGGNQVFELDERADAQFHTILSSPERDIEHLRILVEAVNRCYFPHQFDGIQDRLCLWVGHRLDEQPTKSFIASECIPQERLSIHRPVPPSLKDALDYGADHLLLRASSLTTNTGVDGTELRIDAILFRTLSAVREGLPRHLINSGELNRLDAFVDRLKQLEPSDLGKFLVFNTRQVVSAEVRLSSNSYVDIKRLNSENHS